MKARRSRRVRGIERHVGAAGLEHAEDGDDQSRASAPRQMPANTSRPDPELAEVVREPRCPRVELAVGQALLLEGDRERVRRPRRPGPRSAGGASRRAGNSRGAVLQPLRRSCGAPRPSATAARRAARPGSATIPCAAESGGAPPSARSWISSKRSVAVLEDPAQPRGPRIQAQASDRTSRSRPRRRPRAASARERHGLDRRASWSWNEHLEERRAAEIALGRQLAGPGSRRACPGGRRRRAGLAHPRQQLANGDRPSSGARSTRVLTKKPIRLSSLGPGRGWRSACQSRGRFCPV